VINPANNEVIAELTCTTEAELALAVASAKTAFESWKQLPASERARVMSPLWMFPMANACSNTFILKPLEQHKPEIGQADINIPIPVSLPFFSFTGCKHFFYGYLHAYAKQAVRFYTATKTMTVRWFEDDIASGSNMTISLK
jgi:acyl-CoA reductase-like NAD-dependent aldehyde dehydrogenase